MILFENFKSFLQLVVSNAQTVSQNVVLQDTAYAQAVADHISALTPDQNIRLDSTMVPTGGASGLLVNDELKRELRFEWKGAERLQGWIRPLFQNQGNVGSQFNKIWVRSDDVLGSATTVPYGTLADGRRYYVTDQDHGVFYLNEYGQVLGAVPGFAASPAVLPDYGLPSSAITFTVGVIEYIAITNSTDHLLTIYDTATFTLAASFGTSGTPGLPSAGLLDSPVDLAADETNSILYVACQGGLAPGATSPGLVASFDISTLPAAPVFASFVAINTGNGTLPQGEITVPRGLFYDITLSALWILNDLTTNAGSPYPAGFPYMEAGALSVDIAGASESFLDAHIDGRTENYWLRQQDTKLHLDNDRRKLYIGNVGGVESFDLATLKHQLHFGYYSEDTSLLSGSVSPLVPPATFPSVSDSNSVAADIVTIDGAFRNLILFTDGTNNRFVRVPEDAYLGDNLVTFNEMTFTVPLSLHGYLVKGTLSSSKVCVEYRTVTSGVWQRLAQTDIVPASLFFQFRLRVTPDLSDIIDEKSVKEIVIVGTQE